jgi:hypothetical protein
MSGMSIEFEAHECWPKPILFDLFDTLLLLLSDWLYACLTKMHRFLVENRVDVPFDDFSRVYFEVRNEFHSETRESLEEPHFNVRISPILQKLGYDYGVVDPVVVGATKAFAEEFTHHV